MSPWTTRICIRVDRELLLALGQPRARRSPPDNPAAILSGIGISLMGTPSEAKSKVARGQGPSGIHRIDRPNSSVPESQWHSHSGPGEGSAAVNLNGTPKHGDNLDYECDP